jgi:hypothetical protein
MLLGIGGPSLVQFSERGAFDALRERTSIPLRDNPAEAINPHIAVLG